MCTVIVKTNRSTLWLVGRAGNKEEKERCGGACVYVGSRVRRSLRELMLSIRLAAAAANTREISERK